jgi:hypothetical protein
MVSRNGFRRNVVMLCLSVGVLASLLAACGGSSTTSTSGTNHIGAAKSTNSSSSGCHVGDQTVNGLTVVVYCGGSASAQGTFGGQHMSWSGGECDSQGGEFVINMGTLVAGASSVDTQAQAQKHYDYFGIIVPDKGNATYHGDGTYTGGITGTYKGNALLLDVTVTISDNGKKGTFSGTGQVGSQMSTQSSGSWAC